MPLLNLVDSLTIPHVLLIINRNSRTIWNIQSRFCIHANNCYFCKCNCISVNTTLNFRIGQKRYKFGENNNSKYKSTSACFDSTVNNMVDGINSTVKCRIVHRRKGSSMLTVMIGSSYFTAVMVLSIGVLQGINRSAQAAWIVIGASCVKVMLNMMFVQKFGIDGAAYSTLITYVLICIVNHLYIRSYIAYSIHLKAFSVC